MLVARNDKKRWKHIKRTMKENIEFEIKLRRKVPYITNILLKLSILFGLLFFITVIPFLPTQRHSSYTQVANFFLILYDLFKKILPFAAIGFLATYVLGWILHSDKKALLTFNPKNILITGRDININIPINSIYRVYSMDLKSPSGESKEILKIGIKDKDKKTTYIRLLDYSQADEFMDKFIAYESIDIFFYEFDNVNEFDKES